MLEPGLDAKERQQIYEQAALWMLRKEDGPLTCAERRRHEAWLKLPHRAEALRRMEAFSARVTRSWRRR